jgi:hypothetical protein
MHRRAGIPARGSAAHGRCCCTRAHVHGARRRAPARGREPAIPGRVPLPLEGRSRLCRSIFEVEEGEGEEEKGA